MLKSPARQRWENVASVLLAGVIIGGPLIAAAIIGEHRDVPTVKAILDVTGEAFRNYLGALFNSGLFAWGTYVGYKVSGFKTARKIVLLGPLVCLSVALLVGLLFGVTGHHQHANAVLVGFTLLGGNIVRYFVFMRPIHEVEEIRRQGEHYRLHGY